MFNPPRDARQLLLRVFGILWLACSMNVLAGNPQVYEVYGPDLKLSLPEVQKLHEKAWTLYFEGKYTAAWDTLNQALKITEDSFGKEHQDMAILLATAAEGHAAIGEADKVESLLDRCLSIGEKSAGRDSLIVGRILNELAGVRLAQGQTRKAEALLARFERIVNLHCPQEHPANAVMLQLRGSILFSEGKYEDALDAYRRSSQMIAKTLGTDNQLYGLSLKSQAEACLWLADYAQAQLFAERSVQILEKVLGSGHLNIARGLGTLASAYEFQGNYKDALPVLERSFAILGKAFGPEHFQMAGSLNHLGDLNAKSGSATEAMNCFTRAFKIYRANLGHTNSHVASTLNRIGELLLDQQHNDEAMRCFRESLAIHEALWGKGHPDVANDLYNVGKVLRRMGDRAQATEMHRKCLEIQAEFLSESHPAVTVTLLNLAIESLEDENAQQSLDYGQRMSSSCRQQFVRQAFASSDADALRLSQNFYLAPELLQSICAEALRLGLGRARTIGAEQLALGKALLVESQTIKANLEADPKTSTRNLRDQHRELQSQLENNSDTRDDSGIDAARRKQLQLKLIEVESQLAQSSRQAAQTILDQKLSLTSIAGALTSGDALVDIVQFRRLDLAAKTNQWKEQRYAAYLTFPLARDSTNVVVERVDLGETAPINEAVELVCKRMSTGQFAAKDLSPALQWLSQLVYAPLAPYLTNVSHLIVCPDGQLSRLPFEALPCGHDGNKFLVEEKTISYVTSGREVVRIAKPLTRSAANLSADRSADLRSGALGAGDEPGRRPALLSSDGEREGRGAISKSLVMGDPDFDLDLRSSRREEAHPPNSEFGTRNAEQSQSLLTSAATRALSRDARGLNFKPLPGSSIEATNVARMLGSDAVLRLGTEAREAVLKAVQSPRVLHLATHGFFLSDQEIKRAPHPVPLPIGWGEGVRRTGEGYDWENPLVRCGIALAGANHATNLMSRRSRREEAQTPISQRSTTNSQPNSQSLLTTRFEEEDGLLTGLEASLLNLQGTELVILSACQTGEGEVKIGEGVMSLRQAFRIAGAETVLASHWKVSDKATSRLMTEFMRRWRGGEPRAKAWREAQLELLRSKEFANPYFWAAFTLTGQWN